MKECMVGGGLHHACMKGCGVHMKWSHDFILGTEVEVGSNVKYIISRKFSLNFELLLWPHE